MVTLSLMVAVLKPLQGTTENQIGPLRWSGGGLRMAAIWAIQMVKNPMASPKHPSAHQLAADHTKA